MKTLTDGEAKLIGKILADCAEKYSNHGCNDMRDEWHEHLSDEESKEIAAKVFITATGEDPVEMGVKNVGYLLDWELMDYFANRLSK